MGDNRIHGPMSSHIPDINEYLKREHARWEREIKELAKKVLKDIQKD